MSGTSTYKQVKITDRSNAPPGERIRAVGMCFYGSGQDLTTNNLYRLKRNPSNPKDDSCIELTQNGVLKATMNASLSKLMAPLIDNAIIREPKCRVLEDAIWTRGDSRRPARAHKVEVKFITNLTDLELVQDIFKAYNVNFV